MFENEFKKAFDLLLSSPRIVLTTHEGTDGDDLGSLLAIFHTLKINGVSAKAQICGGVPNNLLFLPGSELVEDAMADLDFDLLVTFGCNRMERIGFEILKDFHNN